MWSSLLLAAITPQDPAPATTILSISSEGLPALLADSKDRGLLELCALVEPRLEELALEMSGEMGLPPATLALLGRLLVGPVECEVLRPVDGSASAAPLLLRLSIVEADSQAALARAQGLAHLLNQNGLQQEVPQSEGMIAIQGLPFSAWLGSQGNRALLVIGSEGMHAGIAGAGASTGSSAMRLKLSYGEFLRYANELSGQATAIDPLTEEVLKKFGMSDMDIDMEWSLQEQNSRLLVRQLSLGNELQKSGILPEGGLPAAVLKFVPEDTLWAQIAAFDFQAYFDLMFELMGDNLKALGVSDPVAEFERASGFHLERDLFDHMGTTWGIYASDTTGGGGMMSMVAFLSLTRPDGMMETLTRAADLLNATANAQAQGRVHLKVWESEGVTYSTLAFPGLPIPIEPTYAIAGNMLFVGATPQATLGAVHQALHAQTSLIDNPRFTEQLPAQREGMAGLLFLDSPRLLRGGYGSAALLCSALANATRSPHDESRDAGLVLPPYHELVRGAKAVVGFTRFTAGGIVQEILADRSLAVNMTALAGFLIEGPILPMLGLVGVTAAQSGVTPPFPEMEIESNSDDGY